MKRIRFTPRAKRHLTEIWDYSARRWGVRRADRYLKALNDAIASAIAGRRRLQPCEQYGLACNSFAPVRITFICV